MVDWQNRPVTAAEAAKDRGASWAGAKIPPSDVTVYEALKTAPFYDVASGYIYNSSTAHDSGVSSFYISKSVLDKNQIFHLVLTIDRLYPSHYSHRYFGYSLRCLHQS